MGTLPALQPEQPCNIYFAAFSLTITFNMQYPPKIYFYHYTGKIPRCQQEIFFCRSAAFLPESQVCVWRRKQPEAAAILRYPENKQPPVMI